MFEFFFGQTGRVRLLYELPSGKLKQGEKEVADGPSVSQRVLKMELSWCSDDEPVSTPAIAEASAADCNNRKRSRKTCPKEGGGLYIIFN